MKPIIRVENLSKQYIIGGAKEPYSTLRESLVNTARLPLNAIKRRNKDNGDNSFWALKDINFEVMPGEVVGIIGRNGAGKSTLLKILSRITEPTNGRVELYGRVGSLLEVGTGFHQELTGRENIFLNGAILGMKRGEIARKLDEIIAFAEIEKFIDTPVKFYSSGMYTRLAFAVAAILEPEILIVDEVLAVGDAEFQKKCLGKMQDVSQNEGRTVLFVSHNMIAIESLCQKVVYLDKGEIKKISSTKEVISLYLSNAVEQSQLNFDSIDNAIGDETIKIKSIKVFPSKITVEDEITIKFEFWNLVDNENLFISFDLYNSYDVTVFSTISPINVKYGSLGEAHCVIPPSLLNDDTYNIYIFFFTQNMRPLFRQKDIYSFTVEDVARDFAYYGKINGIVRPKLKWKIIK